MEALFNWIRSDASEISKEDQDVIVEDIKKQKHTIKSLQLLSDKEWAELIPLQGHRVIVRAHLSQDRKAILSAQTSAVAARGGGGGQAQPSQLQIEMSFKYTIQKLQVKHESIIEGNKVGQQDWPIFEQPLRSDIQQRLSKQNCRLIIKGRRRIGKTFTLQSICQELQMSQHPAMMVNCDREISIFLERFHHTAAKTFEPGPLVRPTSLPFFEVLLRWLLECGVVIILDEFQMLPITFFDSLRNVLDKGYFKGGIVLSGSHVTRLDTELDPIYGRGLETIWFSTLRPTEIMVVLERAKASTTPESFLTFYTAMNGIIGYYEYLLDELRSPNLESLIKRLDNIFSTQSHYAKELNHIQLGILSEIIKNPTTDAKNFAVTYAKSVNADVINIQRHVKDLIDCGFIIEKECYFNKPSRYFVKDNTTRSSMTKSVEQFVTLEGTVLEELSRVLLPKFIKATHAHDITVDDRFWYGIQAEIDIIAISTEGHYYWGSCKRQSAKQNSLNLIAHVYAYIHHLKNDASPSLDITEANHHFLFISPSFGEPAHRLGLDKVKTISEQEIVKACQGMFKLPPGAKQVGKYDAPGFTFGFSLNISTVALVSITDLLEANRVQ